MHTPRWWVGAERCLISHEASALWVASCTTLAVYWTGAQAISILLGPSAVRDMIDTADALEAGHVVDGPMEENPVIPIGK